jgi:hypothetical protein
MELNIFFIYYAVIYPWGWLVAFTATLYNKIFPGHQPCQLVKRQKKTTFQGPSLSSSSGHWCIWSKSHYSWRSVNQSVLVSSPFWGSWLDSTSSQVWLLRSFVSWGAPSDEGAGLSFVWSLSLSFVQLYICGPTINYSIYYIYILLFILLLSCAYFSFLRSFSLSHYFLTVLVCCLQ